MHKIWLGRCTPTVHTPTSCYLVSNERRFWRNVLSFFFGTKQKKVHKSENSAISQLPNSQHGHTGRCLRDRRPIFPRAYTSTSTSGGCSYRNMQHTSIAPATRSTPPASVAPATRSTPPASVAPATRHDSPRLAKASTLPLSQKQQCLQVSAIRSQCSWCSTSPTAYCELGGFFR
jgi:hypothetical protein